MTVFWEYLPDIIEFLKRQLAAVFYGIKSSLRNDDSLEEVS